MGEKDCRGCKHWGDWQKRTEKLFEPSEATPVWDPETAKIGLCAITDKIVRDEGEAGFDWMVMQVAALRPYTWCLKRGREIPTETLRGRECLNCPHLVDRGGTCDPRAGNLRRRET